jgi:hypothetical protein
VILHFAAMRVFQSVWSPKIAFFETTGADQFWVFGAKYFVISAAFLILTGIWSYRFVSRRGWFQTVVDRRVQLLALNVLGVFLIPNEIVPPGYTVGLGYVAMRLSMVLPVLICVVAMSVRGSRAELLATCVTTALFFSFVYADERALNGLENRLEAAVGTVPARERVVFLVQSEKRANPGDHILDRVCIGRCFSYGNYEASTRQFRVRASGPNPIVMWDHTDFASFAAGRYAVQTKDLPLWVVGQCEPGGTKFCAHAAKEGEVLVTQIARSLPALW